MKKEHERLAAVGLVVHPFTTNHQREQHWYLRAYSKTGNRLWPYEWRLNGLDTPTLATMMDVTPAGLQYGLLEIRRDQVRLLCEWLGMQVDHEQYQCFIQCKHVLRGDFLRFG